MGNLSRRYVEAREAQKEPAASRVCSDSVSSPPAEPHGDFPPDDRKSAEIRRGRPRLEHKGQTREALKPWQAAGMSRATYYRRLREAREAREKNG